MAAPSVRIGPLTCQFASYCMNMTPHGVGRTPHCPGWVGRWQQQIVRDHDAPHFPTTSAPLAAYRRSLRSLDSMASQRRCGARICAACQLYTRCGGGWGAHGMYWTVRWSCRLTRGLSLPLRRPRATRTSTSASPARAAVPMSRCGSARTRPSDARARARTRTLCQRHRRSCAAPDHGSGRLPPSMRAPRAVAQGAERTAG